MSVSATIKTEIKNMMKKQSLDIRSSQQKIIETVNKNQQNIELKIAAQDKKVTQKQDSILHYLEKLEGKLNSL